MRFTKTQFLASKGSEGEWGKVSTQSTATSAPRERTDTEKAWWLHAAGAERVFVKCMPCLTAKHNSPEMSEMRRCRWERKDKGRSTHKGRRGRREPRLPAATVVQVFNTAAPQRGKTGPFSKFHTPKWMVTTHLLVPGRRLSIMRAWHLPGLFLLEG